MNSNKRSQILLVDDNIDYCKVLAAFLEKHDHDVIIANNAKDALSLLTKIKIDLILLDIIMPDSNGIELCKTIKNQYSIPIVMLSGVDEESEKIVSLELGAQCFLNKSTSPRLILAQIKTLLKTLNTSSPTENSESAALCYTINDCTFDPNNHVIRSKDSESTVLTNNECKLLELLVNNPRKILTREKMISSLKIKANNVDRSIDVIICRLRTKFGVKHQHLIKTIRGKGYCLDSTPYQSSTLL